MCIQPPSDVIGHDEDNAGPDESEFDDERVEVGRRPDDGITENIVSKNLTFVLHLFRFLDRVQEAVASAVCVAKQFVL